MICRLDDLKKKEVINICDGRCLGCVVDLDICLPDGKIEAIAVPGSQSPSFLNIFKSGDCMVIPWCHICKIGDDVILVELPKHFFKQRDD